MKFSIICVYNNKKILEKYLLSSLKKQTEKYQLVLLDNTKNRFKSAAEALNYGAKKAKGKYLMFVHQDVELQGKDWLKKAENSLSAISDLGIAGVAGMSECGEDNLKRGRNIIWHGNPPAKWSWGNKIDKPERVQTLDECLLTIPKSVFKLYQFDEKTCHDWHLYGADYCLSIRQKNLYAYVIPIEILHFSVGKNFSKHYYKTLKKILKKHKKNVNRIYTTMGDWNTNTPLYLKKTIHNLKLFLKK